MTRRRSLTKRETIAMLDAQNGICACSPECELPVTLGCCIREHTLPVALGNRDKPDAILHPDCAREKTAKDIDMICKADRQRLYHETGRSSKSKPKKIPSRPLQSRGFQGHRKFDGTVVWK